jgi:hypothetical protein
MPFQSLYKNIFNNNEPDEGDKEMLSQWVKKYPYFSLAHFFLLKQMGVNEPGYEKIVAKTALHFNNPFLLNEQLHKGIKLAQDETLNSLAPNAEYPEEELFAPVLKTEELAVPISIPEPVIIQDETELVTVTEEEEIKTNNIPEAIPGNFKEAALTAPASEPETTATEDALNKPAVLVENVESALQDPVPTNAAYENAVEDKVTPMAEVQASEEINPLIKKEEPLVFEPLFASDYFASQGIKLREEAQPTDKLGKQLKSFTDWLKTMKKVHENKLPSANEDLDRSVQVMAEKSNKEEEVLTETMAEVYMQQGKLLKAKEIYEKLSLLNPSKSAYFAAKIEQIQ